MDDLPFDYGVAARPALAAPTKCQRHDWFRVYDDPSAPQRTCRRCGAYRDEAVVRRNLRNRNRGKGTSRDLAAYLGWQNVEGMGWPWDIQANHGRIQSKRDQLGAGPARALRLIDAIPAGDWLRGLFHVAPGARLTSGTVTVLLAEWVSWYGWAVPTNAKAESAGTTWLLRLPLPVFAASAGKEGNQP